MPTVKISYAYMTCIRCGKERYKTLKRYQKMLEKQSPEEVDQTFVCGQCLKAEKASK